MRRRPARLRGSASTSGRVLEEGARRDVVVDPHEVLAHDAAGAQVGVPDLGVPHLPVGQADRPARRVELGVRIVCPEAVEDRRVGELDRVPRPRRRQAPAVEHDEADEGSAHAAAAARIASEVLRHQARASDQPAVDVGLREELGGVLGLHRAAVLDPHRLGHVVAVHLGDDGADAGVGLLGHRRRRRAAGADRPDRLVRDRRLGAPARRRCRGARPRPGGAAPARSRPPRARPRSRRPPRSPTARHRAAAASLAFTPVVGLAEELPAARSGRGARRRLRCRGASRPTPRR